MRNAARKFIIPILLLCLSVFCFACSAEGEAVLMYIIGGDLETEQGAATQDLHEMMHALRSYPEKSVVAFLCGSEKWWLPGLEDGHSYTLKIQSEGYEILRDHGLFSGTTESALTEFLKQYASDGADLIFWGHGIAGASGVGQDLLFDLDTLTLYELQASLEEAKVDFRLIGFDACSMATLQSAWMLHPYCELFCASRVDEPLRGWSYNGVLPLLFGQEPLTPALLRQGFRDPEVSILPPRELYDCRELLCQVLERSFRSDSKPLLSDLLEPEAHGEILRLLCGSDLLITHWPSGELPTEELLPGIGSAYRAYLTRK